MLSESSEQLTKYCKSYFIVKGGTCESVSACWMQSMTVTDEQSAASTMHKGLGQRG